MENGTQTTPTQDLQPKGTGRTVKPKTPPTRTGTKTGTGTRTKSGTGTGTGTAAPTPTGTGTPTGTLPQVPEGIKTGTDPAVNVEPVTAEVNAPYRDQLPKTRDIQGVITNQSSLILLALLDGIASMLFGPDAMMSPAERQMLSEPLDRMLSRLEISQTEAVKKWTDPILFVMGMIAWGSRVARQQAAKRPKETPIEASQRNQDSPQAPPPPQGPQDRETSYNAPSDISSLFGGSYMTAQQRPA